MALRDPGLPACQDGQLRHDARRRAVLQLIEPVYAIEKPGRGQIHPQTFLGDYRGIVMSDGLFRLAHPGTGNPIGCMGHSRRRFVDAAKVRKKGGGPPEQALRFFE